MKIRTDFVTNSSSSSFVCYRFNPKSLDEFLKKEGYSLGEYGGGDCGGFKRISDDLIEFGSYEFAMDIEEIIAEIVSDDDKACDSDEENKDFDKDEFIEKLKKEVNFNEGDFIEEYSEGGSECDEPFYQKKVNNEVVEYTKYLGGHGFELGNSEGIAGSYKRVGEWVSIEDGDPEYWCGEWEIGNVISEISGYKLKYLHVGAVEEELTLYNIKAIDENAFSNETELRELTIILDDEQTEIEENAFRKCSKLVKIEFPETLKEIGAGAFEDCENLEEIVFSGKLEKIGENAFKGCNKLKNIPKI